MPNSKIRLSDGGNKTAKRSLPSWMNSKPKGNSRNGKKAAGSGEDEDTGENERPEQSKGLDGELVSSTLAKKSEGSGKPSSLSLDTLPFSKLLEGVVFVLSGFINPERSTLRSQALEMGAEYQPDWNSDCTLLICAFPNTPKFRQVEADNGTIVAKEWITECYTQRKLVDIESYLMHAGKPWRRSTSDKSGRDSENSPSRGYHKHVEKRSQSRQLTAASSKKANSNVTEDVLIPSKVKSWVIIDLNRTTTWLESQEEKPPADEIKKIAAEGIITCLQDAIDALEQNQDVRRISEQWNIVPRVVEELIKLEGSGDTATSISNADLHRKAVDCKQIYEAEYSKLEYDASVKRKKPSTDDRKSKGKKAAVSADAVAGYDSDETIEMTEEEIELAYNTVAAKVPEF